MSRCDTTKQNTEVYVETSFVLKTPHKPYSCQPESLALHWSLNTAGKVHAAPESDDKREPVKKNQQPQVELLENRPQLLKWSSFPTVFQLSVAILVWQTKLLAYTCEFYSGRTDGKP